MQSSYSARGQRHFIPYIYGSQAVGGWKGERPLKGGGVLCANVPGRSHCTDARVKI